MVRELNNGYQFVNYELRLAKQHGIYTVKGWNKKGVYINECFDKLADAKKCFNQ